MVKQLVLFFSVILLILLIVACGVKVKDNEISEVGLSQPQTETPSLDDKKTKIQYPFIYLIPDNSYVYKIDHDEESYSINMYCSLSKDEVMNYYQSLNVQDLELTNRENCYFSGKWLGIKIENDDLDLGYNNLLQIEIDSSNNNLIENIELLEQSILIKNAQTFCTYVDLHNETSKEKRVDKVDSYFSYIINEIHAHPTNEIIADSLNYIYFKYNKPYVVEYKEDLCDYDKYELTEGYKIEGTDIIAVDRRILTSKVNSTIDNNMLIPTINETEEKYYGDFETYIKKAILTDDGNIIAIGFTNCDKGNMRRAGKGLVELPNSQAFSSIPETWVAKFDESLKLVWIKHLDSANNNKSYPIDIYEINKGEYNIVYSTKTMESCEKLSADINEYVPLILPTYYKNNKKFVFTDVLDYLKQSKEAKEKYLCYGYRSFFDTFSFMINNNGEISNLSEMTDYSFSETDFRYKYYDKYGIDYLNLIVRPYLMDKDIFCELKKTKDISPEIGIQNYINGQVKLISCQDNGYLIFGEIDKEELETFNDVGVFSQKYCINFSDEGLNINSTCAEDSYLWNYYILKLNDKTELEWSFVGDNTLMEEVYYTNNVCYLTLNFLSTIHYQ